ncbi:MAG: hypothetical protein ACYDA8_15125 [Deferrisomatales bacterium]
MGGLAHYLEEEGIPTTQISLIREHTAVIRPPRALWVPFELGRPLGAPGDPPFQTRVLRAALELLTAASGPVLADFPDDAPGDGAEAAPLACPVSFPAPEPATPLEALLGEFRREVDGLRGWYYLGVERRGRTTAASSGLSPEAAADLVAAWARGERPPSPVAGLTPAHALRLAAEDLKSYYLEAAAARPGPAADRHHLAEWFWGSTRAARVLGRVRERCLASEADDVKLLGRLLLIPRSQLHRFG